MIDKKVSYSDSILLIKEIFSEMYTDYKNIKKASYRINGIIGSALSHRETMTKEEIYNLLNIKLRRSDIAEFVFHRKFEKFIYSKSVEKSLWKTPNEYGIITNYKMLFGYPEPGDNFDEPVIEHL